MSVEKRLLAVPAQSFTANGTSDGLVSIADTSLFKVKQLVYLSATSLPDLDNIEVKRVVSQTQLYVGPKGGSIDARINISAYTLLANAAIGANEQSRPSIPNESIERATYEEEPVLARRVLPVDKYGNVNDSSNPVFVADVNRLVKVPYDDILMTYDVVTQDLTQAVYKFNGNIVATVALTYDAYSNLIEAKVT